MLYKGQPSIICTVLQGICKLLLKLWFTPAFVSNIFSVSSEIDIVNKRLLEIKPPDLITKVPRSLEDRQFWKASELHTWLLFLCSSVPFWHLSRGMFSTFGMFGVGNLVNASR